MQKDKEKIRMYNTIYVLTVVLIGFLCLLANYIYNRGAAETVFNESDINYTTESEPLIMTVYVTGEVNAPGLYEMEQGTRVTDAIEKAGGATVGADLEGVNLAKVLKDGDQIKVPALNKTSVKTTTSKTTAKTTGSVKTEKQPVDINCGDVKQYMTLSGMTEELAQNIVKHIEIFGAFQSIEELQFVEGMTPSLYKKLESQFEGK